MSPSEEYVAFYLELGIALSQWAHVESALLGVVATCVDQAHRKHVGIGFYSIENFRSKLTFADNLVQFVYGDTSDLDRWRKLFERMQAKSVLRNYLAHRRVIVYPNGKPGRRYALVPWIQDKPPRNPQIAPPGSLCLRDIVSIRLEFVALSNALWNFWNALMGFQESFPKSAEQAARPPTIQTIRRQIHEVLGHPLKPSRKK